MKQRYGRFDGMAIFVPMLNAVRLFLNRPVVEDFSFKNQIWQALQGGLYVFLFIYFFGDSSFAYGPSRVWMLALFGLGCVISVLVANWVIPALLPMMYNEDRWVVWKQILQTLFLLLCISAGNQILLVLTHNNYPTFWRMYLIVTTIGFFPIIVSVFVAEQRRLKRNLAHAQALNDQLAHRVNPPPAEDVPSLPGKASKPTATASARVVLTSESGKEQLSLPPDQLLYVESVGNYVEVHWLNLTQPQKTVLRSTLKELAELLSAYPQFFRCHRAFLVNLKAVSQTEGNARGYQLTITGASTKIPVSRGYLEAFDEQMKTLI